jgi:hypothetical protein
MMWLQTLLFLVAIGIAGIFILKRNGRAQENDYHFQAQGPANQQDVELFLNSNCRLICSLRNHAVKQMT